MEKLQLEINGKIEIIWEGEYYKSNIQDVGDQTFSISIPTRNGEFIPLRKDEFVELVYYQELNIFQFNSRVLGRRIDGVAMIILEIPTKYKVVQRREYYRVPKLDSLYFSKDKSKILEKGNNMNQSRKLSQESNVLQKAVLLDLSGGGMKIKISQSVELGEVLHLFLNTFKDQIEIYGEAVRIERDEQRMYICGICFLELTNSEREKIIQYTFEIMRNQRSKGL